MPVVTTRVIARNNIGRFIAECEQAANSTVKTMLDEAADVARENAPVGHKPDPRTVPLRDSIESVMLSRTSGRIESHARHAAAQEFGAAHHQITGWVKFWWEDEGRWWEPGDNMIEHPGNPAQPFMEPAFRAMFRTYADIAARYYPG